MALVCSFALPRRVPNTGKWLTASKGNKNSSLLVFTLQFLFLTQDNAVTRPEGFWLRVLTLMQKKQAEVKELKAKRDNTRSFRTVAKAWFSTKTKWSDYYGDAVWKRLETYVFPVIGDKDVAELDTGDLLVPVKKVEALGYLEVAMRIQQYITAILRHAVQQKLIRHNPAYDMEGAVQKPQTEHRPALELEEIPQLLNKIAEYKGRRLTILAIQLNLMIFIRSSELRFARWSEIDFKSKLWVIPEQREAIENVKHSTRGAKMKRKHFVPLVSRP